MKTCYICKELILDWKDELKIFPKEEEKVVYVHKNKHDPIEKLELIKELEN